MSIREPILCVLDGGPFDGVRIKRPLSKDDRHVLIIKWEAVEEPTMCHGHAYVARFEGQQRVTLAYRGTLESRRVEA
jgi:hypothetical protein